MKLEVQKTLGSGIVHQFDCIRSSAGKELETNFEHSDLAV
jgi:hypothetical protein